MDEYKLKPQEQPITQEDDKGKPIDSTIPQLEESAIDALAEQMAEGSAFAVDYFNVPGWGKLLLEKKLDIDNTVEKVAEIEMSVNHFLTKNSMKKDKGSFGAVLKKIEDRLALKPEHDPRHRVNRVHEYLKSVRKIRGR